VLRQALRLWHGDALGGVPGRWAEQVRQAWLQQHLDAMVAWADAELRAGEPASVLAARFPDGQLYADLGGFGRSARPLDPIEVVHGFLGALGVDRARIPAGPRDRIAFYRSRLAGRRVLLVLDNARNADQVRPLLPGSRTAMVLVTSRDQMTGLAAADDAHILPLDVLSGAEARHFLTARLGARVEPAAADFVIARCAGLPPALGVVAARATTSPRRGLADMCGELDGVWADLDDPAADVRAAFSSSYRLLSAPTARLFRLLSRTSGVDVSVATAAGLAGSTPALARSLLAELGRANLLIEHRPGSYRLHTLLHAYAGRLAGGPDE
jgi:transcriptional activator